MDTSEENMGVKERIKSRLMEATDAESLRKIREELKAEGEKQGSIDACVSDLRKQGHLRFNGTRASSTKSMPRDLIPTMQAFIEDVHVPRPVDGRDGFWDGYELGAMRARQDLICSLLAMRELQSQSTSQVVSLAKELRGQQNTGEIAAAAAQQTLAGAMPQLAGIIKDAAVASSPDPFQAMIASGMQPLFTQAMGNLMGLFQGAFQPGASQPGQPAPQPGRQNEQPQGQTWSPPSITEHSLDEWEE